MTVVEMDVRVGGNWRWVTSDSDGHDVPFKGEYLEVVPPEKLVNTEIFDVEPFNAGEPAVVTQILEDLGGRTKLISRSAFSSAEVLEGVLATGMVGGAIESWIASPRRSPGSPDPGRHPVRMAARRAGAGRLITCRALRPDLRGPFDRPQAGAVCATIETNGGVT